MDSIQHLFFVCVVAKTVWNLVVEGFKANQISCFEDVCTSWQFHKRIHVLNMATSGSLWSIWQLRIEFCFQGRFWKSLNCILMKLCGFLLQWVVLCNDAHVGLLCQFILLLN
uniref:Uncharacterized protein n=1 Tax=Hordeum vulgare subsp. vulgare TaxID=112509 RepID=A0A8I6YZD4_HORVV